MVKTKYSDGHMHFATGISWLRLPACGKEGAIFLETTTLTDKVTCLGCRGTPEYNKALILKAMRKAKEHDDKTKHVRETE